MFIISKQLKFIKLLRPILIYVKRIKCARKFSSDQIEKLCLKNKDFRYDLHYIMDRNNMETIEDNILRRKGVGNIKLIHKLYNDYLETTDNVKGDELLITLFNEIKKLPNQTHPDALKIENDEPKLITVYNNQHIFDFKPLPFDVIAKKMNLIRNEKLAPYAGHKSYYLIHHLAELEQALILYTMDYLEEKKFELISVPDLMPTNLVEGCGMNPHGERNQIYKVKDSDLCLSGTSEIALAGYFHNKTLEKSKLPIRLTAMSRCYRAETSGLLEEKGIYRVHQFNKVEMFAICNQNESENLLEEFKSIEIELYNKLELPFKLLDMPPSELGAPANRKYDIEAWLPGRNMWGEISSCSNCTDYQSRRLNIRYIENRTNGTKDTLHYAHTINGTACAIPRMLIAILENYQNQDMTISVPVVLRKYLQQDKIKREKVVPELKLIKQIQLI